MVEGENLFPGTERGQTCMLINRRQHRWTQPQLKSCDPELVSGHFAEAQVNMVVVSGNCPMLRARSMEYFST